MGYADLGNRYRNPILFADYSDPDVIRVGDTFYLTASSFNYTPGLPILVSKDLVNWKLVNYALENIGQERFSIPRHSQGVWAPSIRYHEGMFYSYYGMPDEGIYVVRTKDPFGKWDKPICVLEGKGLIDSCPFWDEDGRAYIIHGYAKSRIGFKSILGIFEMSPDGLKAISEDHFLFDGNDPEHPAITIEGPKVYKRGGYYYIWAPAGGVRQGYQVVLRSKSIQGPYEIRTVMDQGSTVINGPHQGGFVDTINGDEWFIHFQDRGLYGRICHLQPVTWQEDWPVIGKSNGDCGEPVYDLDKPNCELLPGSKINSYFPYLGECEIFRPSLSWNLDETGLEASDNFTEGKIGLQWQWMGDHEDSFAVAIPGEDGIRLYCQNPSGDEEPILWRSSNVLTQKLIYPTFRASVNMDASCLQPGERAGVCMTGGQYVAAFLEKYESGTCYVKTVLSAGGDSDKVENTVFCKSLTELLPQGLSLQDENLKHLKWLMTFECCDKEREKENLYFANVNNCNVKLKMKLIIEDVETVDGADIKQDAMIDLGVDYTPSDHTWVGAKLGLFALAKNGTVHSSGFSDFRNFTVEEI